MCLDCCCSFECKQPITLQEKKQKKNTTTPHIASPYFLPDSNHTHKTQLDVRLVAPFCRVFVVPFFEVWDMKGEEEKPAFLSLVFFGLFFLSKPPGKVTFFRYKGNLKCTKNSGKSGRSGLNSPSFFSFRMKMFPEIVLLFNPTSPPQIATKPWRNRCPIVAPFHPPSTPPSPAREREKVFTKAIVCFCFVFFFCENCL